MPSKICKGCYFKIGFFKKKYFCQMCHGHFCTTCFGSVKSNEEQLRNKLFELTGFNCLRCVVLEFRDIKRDHLYLLQNKHLNEYLAAKNISTVSCTEKYDLIDLIMEYARTNNKQSQEDSAKEFQHDNHLQSLRQAAEDMRVQENISSPHSSNTSHDANDDRNTSTYSRSNMSSPGVQGSPNDQEDTSSILRDEAPPNRPQSTFNDQIEIEDLEDENILDDEENSPRAEENTSSTYSSASRTYSTSHHQQQQQNRQSQSESTANSSTFTAASASFTAEQHQSSSSPRHDSSQEQSSTPRRNNSTTTTTSSTSSDHLSPPTTTTKQRTKWKSMEDVSTIDEINTLTVLELKQILTANFVDYKGCVEKKELIDKVKMLYESREKNKERQQEFSGVSKQEGGDGGQAEGEGGAANYDRDDCKICMDSTIDCVLLNCGHLVACSKCGKRLSECPICRALVVRVVHIFRV